ncbi:hypothetical protein V8C44DRAFT_143781 [Trichoderma aethiopicum]
MTGAISSPKRLSSSRHSPDLEHHHLSPSDINSNWGPEIERDTEDMASSPEGAKDGPWTEETKQKFNSKSKSEFYDPCQEAAQRSYRWRIGIANRLGLRREEKRRGHGFEAPHHEKMETNDRLTRRVWR